MPMSPYSKLISATLSVDESNLVELALLEKTMDGVRGKVPDVLRMGVRGYAYNSDSQLSLTTRLVVRGT